MMNDSGRVLDDNESTRAQPRAQATINNPYKRRNPTAPAPAPVLVTALVPGPAPVLNNISVAARAQAQAQTGRPIFGGIGLTKKRGRPPGSTDSKPRKKQNKNTGVRVIPMNNIFGARAVTAPLAAAAATSAAVAVAVGEALVAADKYNNEEVAAAAAADDDKVVVGTNRLHSEAGEGCREYTPDNIVAELDVDDGQIDNAEAPEGVMAEFLEKVKSMFLCDPPPMFSLYGDKSGYGGSCPTTGNYLSCAYKSFMSEVKPYYDKCMQMLNADRISIDAIKKL